MTDADIRRWLAHQTNEPVGHIARPVVGAGAEAICDALQRTQESLIVVDAIDDNDLLAIGAALNKALLVTGGSGLAIGLPGNFFREGLAKPSMAAAGMISGPEAILAGSCSGSTREQIRIHEQNHPTLAIAAAKVMDKSMTPDTLVSFILSNTGNEPLAYSSNAPEDVAKLQAHYGREPLAMALESLFAETAKLLIKRGVKRLVIAGGETSGAVVSALNPGPLTIGAEIDPGVPVLYSHDAPALGLALKSGNFGAPDFFTKALCMIGGVN